MDALLSPMILFFLLGVMAAAVRSDLAVPEALAKGMALYLMAAIGLKGGVELSTTGPSLEMATAAGLGLGLALLIPVIAFFGLRFFTGLDRLNAASVAAHYGSVSVVTFITGLETLNAREMPAQGYMVAVMAIMETPAILVGLLLSASQRGQPRTSAHGLWRDTFANASVLLLMGSFVIGAVVGKPGFAQVAPVFDAGFRGVLCLFLLDMGLIAMRRLQAANRLTIPLGCMAVALPLCNGALGLAVGSLAGLDPGTLAALSILAASASYIAVPAAMRLALPAADAGLSLAMSLGITFPFNILLGIPLFTAVAKWIAS